MPTRINTLSPHLYSLYIFLRAWLSNIFREILSSAPFCFSPLLLLYLWWYLSSFADGLIYSEISIAPLQFCPSLRSSFAFFLEHLSNGDFQNSFHFFWDSPSPQTIEEIFYPINACFLLLDQITINFATKDSMWTLNLAMIFWVVRARSNHFSFINFAKLVHFHLHCHFANVLEYNEFWNFHFGLIMS